MEHLTPPEEAGINHQSLASVLQAVSPVRLSLLSPQCQAKALEHAPWIWPNSQPIVLLPFSAITAHISRNLPYTFSSCASLAFARARSMTSGESWILSNHMSSRVKAQGESWSMMLGDEPVLQEKTPVTWAGFQGEFEAAERRLNRAATAQRLSSLSPRQDLLRHNSSRPRSPEDQSRPLVGDVSTNIIAPQASYSLRCDIAWRKRTCHHVHLYVCVDVCMCFCVFCVGFIMEVWINCVVWIKTSTIPSRLAVSSSRHLSSRSASKTSRKPLCHVWDCKQ